MPHLGGRVLLVSPAVKDRCFKGDSHSGHRCIRAVTRRGILNLNTNAGLGGYGEGLTSRSDSIRVSLVAPGKIHNAYHRL